MIRPVLLHHFLSSGMTLSLMRVDGKLVNLESAVTQLDRYKFLMDNWTDHNTSITVSYSPDEIPSIIDWILEDKNWSFICW